ncbi:hypothetical protein [Flavicella sp.]|uniref:hypothetical protein n=1 Tax=Flavicella sp. TaxID=2957742 RepID=UPI00301A3530
MKKEFAALFFYMLYMVAMMRPIMPIIEYYANYEYIATILCENRDKPALACNGKCYLQKELNKVSQATSHQNHNHKSSVPKIDFSKYPIAPICENKVVYKNIKCFTYHYWSTASGVPIHRVNLIFRPPLSIT